MIDLNLDIIRCPGPNLGYHNTREYEDYRLLKSYERRNNVNQVAIFLHIPKTAGTTLESIISREYDSVTTFKISANRYWESLDDYRGLPEVERTKHSLISGHMRFGIHNYVPRPSTYITLIRDPIERSISLYHHIQRTKSHHLHKTVREQQLTLRELVLSKISREFDNWQTRTLSGEDQTPIGQCNNRMLDVAAKNLRQYFRVVGVTDRFDETMILLKIAFEWRRVTYIKRNVNRSGTPGHEIREDTIEIVRSNNRFDLELYKVANQIMNDLIQKEGRDFKRMLMAFRLENRVYGLAYPMLYKIYHSRK